MTLDMWTPVLVTVNFLKFDEVCLKISNMSGLTNSVDPNWSNLMRVYALLLRHFCPNV